MPFYIGKGCGDRPFKHLDGRDIGNKKKVRYIENIRALGLEPTIEYIKENMQETDAYKFESVCIKEMRNNKYFPFCTNSTGIKQPPSRRGSKWTPESIKKRSDTYKRNYRLKGIKKNISAIQRAKISESLKGRSLSEEHKNRISQGLIGKKFQIDDISVLERLYLIERKPRKELAELYGCTLPVLKRILSENNIIKKKKEGLIDDSGN